MWDRQDSDPSLFNIFQPGHKCKETDTDDNEETTKIMGLHNIAKASHL